MGAENPRRRTMTAKEAAAKMAIAERTVRMIVAEPREQYEQRAHERRTKAAAMRRDGLTYAEISEQLGISVQAVNGLLYRARKRGETP